VPKFFFLGFEILFGVGSGLDFAGHTLNHLDASTLKRFHLLGII
jgi:hypothetical protein